MLGEQLTLFGEDGGASAGPTVGGYRSPTVQEVTGVTYRQLDYWARTALIEPSIQPAAGSGSQRLYGFNDIVQVKIVKSLLDAGISLQSIRQAVSFLRERGGGAADLARLTLICDGVSIYECTNDDEVIDLLAAGQGVFGIAIGRTLSDVRASLVHLPAEPGTDATHHQRDELAARRSAKKAS